MRLHRSTLKRSLLLLLLLLSASAASTIDASAQRKGGGFTGGGSRYSPPSHSTRPSHGQGPARHVGYGPRRHYGGTNWGGVATGIAAGVIIGAAIANANQPPPPPPRVVSNPPPPRPRSNITIPPASEQRMLPNEVVLEFAGNLSPDAIAALAARHRLVRLDSISFALTNTTYFRGWIPDGRPVRTVLRALGREVTLRAGQPNFTYALSQDTRPAAPLLMFKPPAPATPPATPVLAASGSRSAAVAGDPAQYTLAKLRLSEAHGLARGNDILVAVIDSGVDTAHPEFGGLIAGTFNALESAQEPDLHGTGIAGAIAARSRLMGVAPAARILAIRAFNSSGSSTFAILKSLDHAVGQNARVINMSFAGPSDPAMSRTLAAARGQGVVLVAASGNLGPNAKPQYPAADPNVIAVSATDADDRLFAASNRGRHIAIAAPGVDILLPAPQAAYQAPSGTSFAAAHVSGIVALILERRPGLPPDQVRRILQDTAKDLGPRGRDDQFGAGLADAYQAVMALEPQTTAGAAIRPAAAAR